MREGTTANFVFHEQMNMCTTIDFHLFHSAFDTIMDIFQAEFWSISIEISRIPYEVRSEFLLPSL